MAQNLTSLLQWTYRARGYAVPYNVCKRVWPKFKGAFVATDVIGPSEADAVVLQVDYASMYPSSYQALNISHESFSSSPV